MEVGYHNPGSGTEENFNSTGLQSKKVFTLEVNGEGSDGSIVISHEGYIPPNDNQITSVFNLDFKEGTLPANS